MILFLFILLFRDMVRQIKNAENLMNSKEKNFIIYPPKTLIGYGFLALIFGFFLAGMTIHMILTEENARHWLPILYFSSLPAFLLVMGSLIFLYYFKWRLIVEDESLTQISIIGVKKHFTFKDISEIRFEFQNLIYQWIIYTHLIDKDGKRLCKISSHFVNIELLISRLLEKEIPFKKKPLGIKKSKIEDFKWPAPYDF